MIQFKPIGPRVLVKELDGETVRKSGLSLPYSAIDKPFPQRGMVLACGEGQDWWAAAGITMPVKTGDVVMFSAMAGIHVDVDEETLLVLNIGEILGTVTD